jgi:AraC-like DNA-binding protein
MAGVNSNTRPRAHGAQRPAPRRAVDDARYSAAVIPASTLAGLVDYGLDRGLDTERWFAGTGLRAAQTGDPDARLSFRQVVRILRRALADCGDEGVGLAVGRRATVSGLGALGLSLMAARDMAEVAAIGQKYHPVSGSLMDIDCRAVDGELMVEARERFPEPDLLPFLCEKLFASTLATARALLGPEYRPVRLELRYPPPSYAAAYAAVFGCPVHFSMPHNRLITAPALLARPVSTHSPSARTEALRLCEAWLGTESSTDAVASLRQWLRERLPQPATMAEAARALHLHERTLRRRLAENGTRFRELYDTLRAERATALLADRRLGIAEIAAQLGFSDAREFRRAYKRWTGRPPIAERRK